MAGLGNRQSKKECNHYTSMYTRCPKCPGKNRCVSPDGPPNAKVRFIGEAPGRDEDKKEKVFVGKTGDEVNRHYLPLAGLSRSSIWIGNAIGCMPISTGGKLDPKSTRDTELLNSCANHNLYPSLRNSKPQVIIPMGSFACRAIDPDINLEFQHGIPFYSEKWKCDIFPQYHPSLGIYEPKKMLHIRTDWTRLRKYLRGTLHVAVDEFEGIEDYREIQTEDELHETLDGSFRRPLACDTENRKDHSPYCLTYSVKPGTGYLIDAYRRDLLDVFQDYLDLWTGPYLWHNWLHDYEITTAMQLRFKRKQIVDTMLQVFHLGNLPQGLKALAYRELGMNMQDFDDLVRPFSSQLALNYYRQAACETWPKPEERLEKQKDGTFKIKKPHGFNQKLKRFFTDFEKNEDKDLFKMWDENWTDEQEMVKERMGEFPGLCISHVPREMVVRYAAQDADGLLRFYPILRHMQRMVRRRVQENWRDAA